MEVRRLQRHEVDLYHTARLRALTDSPIAFGKSLEDVEEMPPEFWTETVERFATSPDQILFLACEGADVCGMVSGRIMRPPVLTVEQAAIFTRALAGATPAPADAAILGPRWTDLAAALAARSERGPEPERDPRQVFDFLTGSGLGFADVARIMPFPPPGGPHGGPRGGPRGFHGGRGGPRPGMPPGGPGNAPPEGSPEGHPPPPFMIPTCVTVMIGGMWVAPAYRRQGLGRILMEAVMTWAESQGAERLELGVVEGNVPAISLYERLGFKIVDRPMPPMPDDAHHFLFMERDILLRAS
jgi:GNAT superfamily N-acetyltransferase